MTTSSRRLGDYLMLALAGVLGWGSLLLLGWFFYLGSLNLVDLSLADGAALGLDACLCLLFFVQHSGMIRRPFRRWAGRFLPPHYQSAFYTIASAAALLLLLVFWQESTRVIVEIEGVARWLLRAVFILAVAGMAWGLIALKADMLGLGPIRAHLRGREPSSIPFTVRGPYRWVRHPLYLFMLLLIWSCPYVTADRLLFNITWTIWVVIGSVLEERDLIAEFGDTYRAYRRETPMLIPLPVRRLGNRGGGAAA
ncbi:MAG: isoprenylcysteine carboxylmethyltransferase family protein [Phycisphaerales bacterium]|nr:MAG: isoprenylcysteine carboxylmethyltransferase family protein [Phycisphaerales bacterium]